MLKQPQYQPVPLEDQVAILYAATNGLLDDVPVSAVGAVEAGFHRSIMHTSHPEIWAAIDETRLDRKFPIR